MGLRYMHFRLVHEVSKRMGWLAKRFPVDPPKVVSISLANWKLAKSKWIWGNRQSIRIPRYLSPQLAESARNILKGKLLLFNSIPYQFSKPEDWVIHPETGFHYDNHKHWTEIPDLNPVMGDIKYVWEKSRFSYLHPVLRYDHHFEEDNSNWVFNEMESWIGQNPINCGPNYRCSQEISLRCFNWMGALTFYIDSEHLTEEKWQLFMHHMHWQLHHVWENIQFSRIAVRNNHAITETLALYVFGTLFPQWPNAATWKTMGKKWLEQEIEYQIYPDGTYLQFSMNYHRVVVQLLTLAIRFAEVNGERFSDMVYQRAHQSLRFLRSCQDPSTGFLPNYGYNDGALFFQFTDRPYRHYSSQLNAMEAALTGKIQSTEDLEEAHWFGFAASPYIEENPETEEELQVFGAGGYAAVKEVDTLTFIRCGRHEDRPAQADNLNLDLWYDGENLIRDAGSYKYNAAEADIRFFVGSRSHNVVMLNGEDQMQKGPRFVWLHWSQAISLSAREEADHWKLAGEIMAFRQLGRNIVHRREVLKTKDKPYWEIHDRLSGLKKNDSLELLWHPSLYCMEHFSILVEDEAGNLVEPTIEMGWYSSLYGTKEEAPFLVFKSQSSKLKTVIQPKS